ncbi:MAG: hypothetical protein JXA89_01830 [Anaerolineae bacterium]|nr:hypothetical protein [Anaerolineae bacterium]
MTMQTDDVPIWPDAAIQFFPSNLFRYRVSGVAIIDRVIDFYQNETPKQGWVAEYEPLRHIDQAVLGFTKDTRSATIIVEQVQTDLARVMVRVSEHWPVPNPVCG